MATIGSSPTRGTLLAAGVALAFAGSAFAQSSPTINEIRIDQPSTDNDEYFELAGEPGTSLDGLTYIVIGDGTGGSGVDRERRAALTGSHPGDGYFLAAEDDSPSATPTSSPTLNFENSDNVTHLLVRGFTGAIGDDLDTDDDCMLDVTPWTAIVDSIALVEDLGRRRLHLLRQHRRPRRPFVPGHVYRLSPTASAHRSGSSTPPWATTPPAIPTTAPSIDVAINEVRIDQPGADNDEYFELVGDPGAPSTV